MTTKEDLFSAIESVTFITKEQILSGSRAGSIPDAKFMFIDLMWRYTRATEQQLADILDRDRSTVNYGKTQHQNRYKFDKRYKEAFIEIENRLHEQGHKAHEKKIKRVPEGTWLSAEKFLASKLVNKFIQQGADLY